MTQSRTHTARRSGARATIASFPGRAALFAGLALAGVQQAEAQTAYCATLGGQLYELDIATGFASPILATGINLLFGLANTTTPDELIVSGVSAGIKRVNVTTGIVTSLTGGTVPMLMLCNNEDDGNVYGTISGAIYRIDSTTGASTLIGPTGAISIYGLDYHQGLQRFIGFNSITNELLSIDPVTAVGTVIGPCMPGIVGLWYDAIGGGLYGVCDLNNNGCVVEIDVTTGVATPLHTTGLNLVSIGGEPGGSSSSSIGVNYCSATPNSTGATGEISASGSTSVAVNSVTLKASNMPSGQFGIFVTSLTQDFVPNVGSGNLCVGGVIGRYQGPGLIQQVDAGGEFSLAIDLTLVPQGAGLVPVAPGETWNFQAWHRDFTTAPPFTNTSNLTNGLAITFQ